LFGVKLNAVWKTTVTGVFRTKSQTKSVVSQGGGTIQDFLNILHSIMMVTGLFLSVF
jgi:hypothetical protein